jgi:uncharacterized repeat protein (TIGR01451 family)
MKRWFSWFIILAIFSSAALPYHPAAASQPSQPPENGATLATGTKGATYTGNMDVRVTGGLDIAAYAQRFTSKSPLALAEQAQTQAAQIRAGLQAFQEQNLTSDVSLSELTGGPEVVRSRQAGLTPAAPGKASLEIVMDFLRRNQGLYGLQAADLASLKSLGESDSPGSGLRMLRLEQMVNGIPVFQSETRFILDRGGRLVRSVGLFAPDATASAAPLKGLVSASQALAASMQQTGIDLDASQVSSLAGSGTPTQAVLNVADGRILGSVNSWLVYFPLAPGLLVPAWAQVTFTNGTGDWYTLVDALSGSLLWRKNIRSNAWDAQTPLTSQMGAASSAAQNAQPLRAPASPAEAQAFQAPQAPSASTQQARFSVYVQADGKTPADSPAPHSPTDVTSGSGTQFSEIARTTVSMLTVQDTSASPNGWIPDGGSTTTGNNVDAYLDTNGDNAPDSGLIDSNGRPVGNPDASTNNRDFLGNTPRDFTYTPAPSGGNPDAGDSPATATFQRGVVTQLFYIANWYHDQLYQLGFNEAAGNFQTDNFGKGGSAGDRVLAEAQDGSGTNNANFSTPPDGTSGRMQMYIFTGPTPDRDGSLDAEVVVHELTHGLSNRLIGNGNGLNWDPGGGMGEGWSDFYALSLLNNTNADDPNGKYATGAYATYKLGGLTDNYLYGIRRFPYSTDNTVNPLTWADVDDVTYDSSGGISPSPLNFGNNGALEVHNVGEIWALSLWEVRSRIIADPAGANGDVPTGNHTMLQLVTDALKMTPINPSFTDARDALIDADCATNACANEASIWAGFADRGLGYGAVAPLGIDGIQGSGGFIGVGESFSSPHLDVQSVAVDDAFGNNNSAFDPGETVNLNVTLSNPWRASSRGVTTATATLSSPTPGVTIHTASAAYGAIPAQGSAGGDSFQVSLDPAAVCGESIHFTIHTTSSLGSSSADFVLRVGSPSGAGAPVTFTQNIPGGLAIPDNNLRGVVASQTITQDLQIAGIQFRLDNLAHTYTGDLTIGLKAPNGYGTDLIYQRGLFLGGLNGDGDNFINTTIDDHASGDLNMTTPPQAPFTGSWLPAFNSPIWSLFAIPNVAPDLVGQLGRLNGTSTQGVWRVRLSDHASLDTGKLNTWSLIVTPTNFVCSVVTPTPQLTITKTASTGSATPGVPITYTLSYQNQGSVTATGVLITDTLPALLEGTAFTSSGPALTLKPGAPYAWSLASLPPNQSGVITVTGTISPDLGAPTSMMNTALITSTVAEIYTPDNTGSASVNIQFGSLAFSQAAYQALEGIGSATITVTYSGPSMTVPVKVHYATADGTAKAGSDYTATSGTLTFNPGVTVQTFHIPIVNDSFYEPDETLTINLDTPQRALLAAPQQAVLTIRNDDPPLLFVPLLMNSGG